MTIHARDPEEGPWLRTDTLHLFKGTFPDDKEVDRLHITVLSAVAPVANDSREAGGKRNVLEVTGFANGSVFDKSVVVSGEEIKWLFQAPDQNTMETWCKKIEAEIILQRYDETISLESSPRN